MFKAKNKDTRTTSLTSLNRQLFAGIDHKPHVAGVDGNFKWVFYKFC